MLLSSPPPQWSDMGAASPQAAALQAQEAGSEPSLSDPTPGIPTLPRAALGPDRFSGRLGNNLCAGATSGTWLEPLIAMTTIDDTTERGQ